MSQPEVNIGTAGHVDHGKTTLLERLTGKWTSVHSEELKKGITIKLGYCDTQVYYCKKCNKNTLKEKCDCGGEAELKRKITFIDAPGHETLMATMLSGAAIMDGALLLIAANEGIQAQTREHLTALEILGITKIIIVQNKIDLVTEELAISNFNQIQELVKSTIAENAPIIPISAQHNANIDILLEYIEKVITTPKRDLKANPLMLIARSFDINKPGTEYKKLIGGVLGGVIVCGELKEGDEIEIKPGFRDQQKQYHSLKTKINTIMSGSTKLKKAIPGGSIGISTDLDMFLTKADRLSGCILGLTNKLPPVYNTLKLEVFMLEKDTKLQSGEAVMLNIWTAKTLGLLTSITEGLYTFELKLPVCAEPGIRASLSKMINNRWHLMGYGIIKE